MRPPHSKLVCMSSRLPARFALYCGQNNTVFWLLTAVIFVLARAATWGFPYDSDHWIFFYVGDDWINRGGQLYVTAWDHKPPLIFLVNGIMAFIAGDSIFWHRVILTGFAVLDAWLFYRLAQKVLPGLLQAKLTALPDPVCVRHGGSNGDSNGTSALYSGAARIALLIYVFWRNLSHITSSGNNTENFGVLLLLALLLAYLRYSANGKAAWLALAGLFCGLLFWFKGNFLLFGAVIGVFLLVRAWRHGIPRLIAHVACYVLPMLAITGILLAYFLYTQGTLENLWLASFGFSAKYASSAWSGELNSNLLLLAQLLAVLLPGALFFTAFFRDRKVLKRLESYRLTVTLTVAGLVLISAVGSFYAYYSLMLMPFIALVAAYALLGEPGALAGLTAGVGGDACRVPTGRGRRGVFAFVASVVLVAALFGNYAISLKQLANSFTGAAHTEGESYRLAADYVRERTTDTDCVLAYDYGAVFYELSGRRSGSRFISASVLLLDWRDGYGLRFDDIFIEEHERCGTRYAVLNDATKDLYLSNEPLAAYLRETFRPVKRFGAIEVWERR